jgi:hypothetical protein
MNDNIPLGVVHRYLAARNVIAVLWCIEDVQHVRADLTADQAWEVLQLCRRHHDCNHGLTWHALEAAAAQVARLPRPRHVQ